MAFCSLSATEFIGIFVLWQTIPWGGDCGVLVIRIRIDEAN